MQAIFDTNILIDYLNGELQAKNEFNSFSKKFISCISYMEILVGAGDEVDKIRRFLNGFEIIWIDEQVADKAVEVRKQYNMKLPDAIILATSLVGGIILVTRNTKDFPVDMPYIRVPYKI